MADDGEMSSQYKRKITLGPIDVHPTESAVVVTYYVQYLMPGEDGIPVLSEKRPMQKIIRVKSLGPQSNLTTMAKEIIEKCKLIHPSKVRDVEQTLYYLQQRQQSEEPAWNRKQMDDFRPVEDESNKVPVEDSSMDQIELYVEGLYEELPEKIASTKHILQLARVPDNMELLISNESLISALTRVLREENKKSMELVTNIMYIFFCFSNFSRYHQFITTNKVGDMCLRITDQEIHRYNIWVQDLAKLEAKCAQFPESTTYLRELDQEHRKFQTMLRKQDQLLFVCFHLLLNLAEDVNIEVKMVKRDIVRYLLILLDRKTPELLILVITFLKKLSIFKENKDEMVKNMSDLLPKLAHLLPSENQGIQHLTLRLLLNISHDPAIRTGLVHYGFLELLTDLLHSKVHLMPVLQLMYQISIDAENRAAFASADTIHLLIKMILEYKGERVNTELMAVAVNIATDPKNAAIICEDNALKFLMKRGLKTRDALMLKILHNIVLHEGDVKFMFLDYIDDLMHLLLKSVNTPDILVEVLGIIGALTIPNFDFAKLAETYNLIEFIRKRLSLSISLAASAAERNGASGASGHEEGDGKGGLAEDDDVTLGVVVLLGTMANDEGIGPIVARTDVISLLIELMIAKEEDDEIILQIIYCIYQLLLQEQTRNILILQTQVVSYLIDLLYDRNIEIRKMCDVCLDIISEIDEEWVKKIKHQKFQWHNSEYLSLLAQGVSAFHDDTNNGQPGNTSGLRGARFAGSGRSSGRSTPASDHRRGVVGVRESDPDFDLKSRRGGGMAGGGAGWPRRVVGDFDDEEDDEDDDRSKILIGGTSALLDAP
ncbi:kinesin-associated protein-domain-containing protein [Zopfochytrium polystomum]|nr:kinesin-associated protein-domain-containing protein [Zopfochytrium polystomum]